MLLDPKNIKEETLMNFKGGEGELITRNYIDDKSKIMFSCLRPGASSGLHRHEGNAEIVYIISGRDKDIAARLMNELDAGATYLSGTGAYTGDRKNVLMCALRMRSLPQARDIVREEDGDAFMIVTKATGVFGEGFKSHYSDDL